MKKTLQLLLLMLMAGSVQAQYFQHAYGNLSSNEELTDGSPTFPTVGMPGHVITGTTDLFGNLDMALGRLDNWGDVNGPSGFLETYRHFDQTGSVLTSRPVEVLHTKTDEIVTVGALTVPGRPEEFTYITKLDANGNVLSTVGFLNPTWRNATPTAAVLSLYNSDHVYVTGYVQYTTSFNQSGTYVYIIAYDHINDIVMNTMVYELIPGKIYNNIPAGIICSPYSHELVVVGNHYDKANGIFEGFFMNADPGSLNWNGALTFYDNRQLDFITGITTAVTGSGGSKGYMICGNNDEFVSGELMPWVFKVDPAGNLLLTNNLPYTNGRHTEINDIVERLNTQGKYEYFVTGYAVRGQVGGDLDLIVYKIDDNCQAFEEYTYGDQGDQIGITLGIVDEPGIGDMGLGIYGRENGGFISGSAPEMYALKTYFNGVLGCGEKLNPANNARPSTWQYSDQLRQPDQLRPMRIRVRQLRKLDQFRYCANSTVIGGDNTRMSAVPGGLDATAFVTPNPVASSGVVTLNTDYAKTQVVNLSLLSLEGKVLDTQVLSVNAGVQQTALNFQRELAAGMYLLQVRAGEQLDVLRLVVE